jgi:molybdate transport system permease protein
VGALVALPIVLPPSVLGFYLLVLMGPNGPVGQSHARLGLGLLPFTFAGLVVASVFYSLPFMVQPMQNAFEALGERPLEAAATLRPRRWTRFSAWCCRCASLAWSPDGHHELCPHRG